MTTHPKSAQDLMLAPVAIEIDTNLRFLRDQTPDELALSLALELNREVLVSDRSVRRQIVLEAVLRSVQLHGYEAAISDDGTRLHVAGGSQSLDLGLSAAITGYLNGAV